MSFSPLWKKKNNVQVDGLLKKKRHRRDETFFSQI